MSQIKIVKYINIEGTGYLFDFENVKIISQEQKRKPREFFPQSIDLMNFHVAIGEY